MMKTQAEDEIRQSLLSKKILHLDVNGCEIANQVKTSETTLAQRICLKLLYAAIDKNDAEAIRQQITKLSNFVQHNSCSDLTFAYSIALCITNPQQCIDVFEHGDENYWTIFWAAVAYARLGELDAAYALSAEIENNPEMPIGNTLILNTIIAIIKSDIAEAKVYFEEIEDFSPELTAINGAIKSVVPTGKTRYTPLDNAYTTMLFCSYGKQVKSSKENDVIQQVESKLFDKDGNMQLLPNAENAELAAMLRPLAEQGVVHAQALLGCVLDDTRESIEWFNKAEQKGDRLAYFQNGAKLAIYSPSKVKQEAGLQRLLEAWNETHDAGYLALVATYYLGKDNISKAKEYLSLGKNTNSLLYKITDAYLNLLQHPQSKTSLNCLNEAAKSGISIAMLCLGMFYLMNAEGKPKYADWAFEWLHEASQHEDSAKQYLGICYLQGIGVEVDLDLAEEAFTEAMEHEQEKLKLGDKDAKNEIKEIKEYLELISQQRLQDDEEDDHDFEYYENAYLNSDDEGYSDIDVSYLDEIDPEDEVYLDDDDDYDLDDDDYDLDDDDLDE